MQRSSLEEPFEGQWSFELYRFTSLFLFPNTPDHHLISLNMKRYLVSEMNKAIDVEAQSIFTFEAASGRWCLKPGIDFHFYVSQPPCK